MVGKIAVRNIQRRFHSVIVHFLVNHQQRHNAQPHPVLKNFIDMDQDVLHLSYLKYITAP